MSWKIAVVMSAVVVLRIGRYSGRCYIGSHRCLLLNGFETVVAKEPKRSMTTVMALKPYYLLSPKE
jgi:hypothetical protein